METADGHPEMTLVLVRHGEAYGNTCASAKEDGSPLLADAAGERFDDELTAVGREQARRRGADPPFRALLRRADAIFVSPLRRTLQTAIELLRGAAAAEPDLMAEADGQRRAHFVLRPLPALREFNRHGVTWWRHRGTTLGELRSTVPEFGGGDGGEGLLGGEGLPPVQVDWNSAGVGDAECWWGLEDAALPAPEQQRERAQRAYERTHAATGALLERRSAEGWGGGGGGGTVLVVGHENTFLGMVGVTRMANCEMLECRVASGDGAAHDDEPRCLVKAARVKLRAHVLLGATAAARRGAGAGEGAGADLGGAAGARLGATDPVGAAPFEAVVLLGARCGGEANRGKAGDDDGGDADDGDAAAAARAMARARRAVQLALAREHTVLVLASGMAEYDADTRQGGGVSAAAAAACLRSAVAAAVKGRAPPAGVAPSAALRKEMQSALEARTIVECGGCCRSSAAEHVLASLAALTAAERASATQPRWRVHLATDDPAAALHSFGVACEQRAAAGAHEAFAIEVVQN